MSKILDFALKNPTPGEVLTFGEGRWRNKTLDALIAAAVAALGFQAPIVISPAALAAGTTNDYAPTGIATARIIRLTPNAAGSTISGIIAPTALQILTLVNIHATVDITLPSANTGSTAANRFLLIGDLTIPANDSLNIFYDLTSARWRTM